MANLGIALPSRTGLGPSQLASLGQQAEQSGFNGCYMAERCSDALSAVAAIAAATTAIEVGTAVSNIYFRHPALMAMTCAAIADLSGGRLTVGLGTGDPMVSTTQLGLAPDPPFRRMREYVAVMRGVLTKSPVDFSGSIFRITGFNPDAGTAGPIPLYVAALRSQMIELAAEIADGVILNLAYRPDLSASVGAARSAAENRGRGKDFRVACVVPLCVDTDRSAALRRGRNVIVTYCLHPSASRLFVRHGYADIVRRVQARLRAGDRDGALREVSDHMVADFVVTGDTANCSEALMSYARAGADLLILFPVAHPDGWPTAITELMTIPRHFAAGASWP